MYPSNKTYLPSDDDGGYTCVLAPKAKGWLVVDRYGDECGEPQFSSHVEARRRADELNDDVILRRLHGLR